MINVMFLLLDHSKAFAIVLHSILKLKLKYSCNFFSTALKLISLYLDDRGQSVSHNSVISQRSSMPKSVSQIFGSLLYSIYGNDLPLQVKHCQIHMHSDDVQLYMGCSASDTPRFKTNLFMDICKWSKYKPQQINGVTDWSTRKLYLGSTTNLY